MKRCTTQVWHHNILSLFLLCSGLLCSGGVSFLSVSAVAQEHVITENMKGGDAAAGNDMARATAPSPQFLQVQELAKLKATDSTRSTAPDFEVPNKLKSLSFDEWEDIRFRADKHLFATDSPFRLEFISSGFIHSSPVRVTLLKRGSDRIDVSDGRGYFEENSFTPPADESWPFAGIRLRYKLNSASFQDEFLVFLGASYYRLIGQDQVFGASQRGLAIDSGSTSGEEFPVFSHFWIEEPASVASSIRLWALLESESVTGAYEFTVTPGEDTVIRTRVSLFAKKDIRKLGIAPLTSMFIFGESSTSDLVTSNFQGEIHDSDGFLIRQEDDSYLWRPLQNRWPAGGVQTTQFKTSNPKGFGLFQRDRDFNNYLDLVTRYEKRPSLWIEPDEQWGPGVLELLEIPTAEETVDNIVAFWTPQKRFSKGEKLAFNFTTTARHAETPPHPLGFLKRLRLGVVYKHMTTPSPSSDSGVKRVVMDFSNVKGDVDGLQSLITTSVGSVSGAAILY